MTPRQVGEIVGFLTAEVVVFGCVWLVIALVALVVARILGRPFTLRQAVRNVWILGIVTVLFILQIISTLNAR